MAPPTKPSTKSSTEEAHPIQTPGYKHPKSPTPLTYPQLEILAERNIVPVPVLTSEHGQPKSPVTLTHSKSKTLAGRNVVPVLTSENEQFQDGNKEADAIITPNLPNGQPRRGSNETEAVPTLIPPTVLRHRGLQQPGFLTLSPIWTAFESQRDNLDHFVDSPSSPASAVVSPL